MSEQPTSAPVSLQEQVVERRPIPHHAGYEAGADGSIWSCRNLNAKPFDPSNPAPWRKLVPLRLTQKGRRGWRKMYKIRRDDGRLRAVRGATLVLEAFVGPRPDNMECCHNDGDSTNDAASNLRWDTHASNEADKLIHGSQRGARNGRARLTEDDVRTIRLLVQSGAAHKILARRYRVCVATISHVANGRNWRHVT